MGWGLQLPTPSGAGQVSTQALEGGTAGTRALGVGGRGCLQPGCRDTTRPRASGASSQTPGVST